MPQDLVNPTYNASGADGLAKLDPLGDAGLLYAACETISGATPAVVSEYKLPGLDGAGSQYFGLDPEDRVWLLDVLADDTAALEAFLDKIRAYRRTAKRYPLVSEMGKTWPYCELRRFEFREPLLRTANLNVYAQLRVVFRDMQPE